MLTLFKKKNILIPHTSKGRQFYRKNAQQTNKRLGYK